MEYILCVSHEKHTFFCVFITCLLKFAHGGCTTRIASLVVQYTDEANTSFQNCARSPSGHMLWFVESQHKTCDRLEIAGVDTRCLDCYLV